MKQNRKNCAAIYYEEECEELVLEAYWQAKEKIKNGKQQVQIYLYSLQGVPEGQEHSVLPHDVQPLQDV